MFTVKFIEKTKIKKKEAGNGLFKKEIIQGSGCGSVGRVVASNSRGLRFESSHSMPGMAHLERQIISSHRLTERSLTTTRGPGADDINKFNSSITMLC